MARRYQPPEEYWDQPGDEADEYDYPEPDLEPYAVEDERYPAEAYALEEEAFPLEDEAFSPPPFVFSNGPGPGLIAVVTVVVCMLMGLGLLAVSGQASAAISAVDEATAAIATQAAQNAAQLPAAQAVAPLAPADCAVSDLFPDRVRRWCGLITQYAQKHSLAPDLVAALIWLESGGDEVAYSKSGAVGLMQVMPSDGLSASFMCINGPCFSDRPTTAQLQDPEFNIAYGTRMLAGLVRKTGDLREALKSYGPMNAGYSYADKVLGIFQRYGK